MSDFALNRTIIGDCRQTLDYGWLAAHSDPSRCELERPWSEGGRTWASQGHYLVSVPGEHAPPRVGAPPLPPRYLCPPIERAPDAQIDLRPLAGRVHARPCVDCRPGLSGTRLLVCGACDGDGTHTCPGCGDDHDCGCCAGSGDVGRCTCSDGRIERHDVLVRVADLALDAAYLVRLAPHLAVADAWCDGDMIHLRSREGDVWATIMRRQDGGADTPTLEAWMALTGRAI